MSQLLSVLKQYWGFDALRPLQAEAMACALGGRDSVVVLPTGGGKSLCFQAPALCVPGMAVVVSPLISLMKDQVDSLADCGVPAACVNSMLPSDERRRVAEAIRAGRLKLLYLAPERLMTERTLDFLRGVPLSFFAIDEAHCISHWGHDFRPEYRELRKLKELFPEVAVHAYTATATPRVRDDIAAQLALRDAEFLVGPFDRPNLVFRVLPRGDVLQQVRETLERHADESGIVYCIRRADVEELAAALRQAGHDALPYHAGLSDDERRRNQDDFINDRVKTIVATVAFGMGIDKSDVRYVIHTAAPKSLESYQQECGRAGRDGLEAECCLFFGAGDFVTWRKLQRNLDAQASRTADELLDAMESFCASPLCRHRSLVEYFGQELAGDHCGACDVCLGEVNLLEEPQVVAQKIASCVLRLGETYGADYTAQVLAGSREARILQNGHDQLSTYGLLAEHDKRQVRNWIEQLVAQRFLIRHGEYQVLAVTDSGREMLRGQIAPRLLLPPSRPRKESKAAAVSWEGVDRGLFEALRALRRRRSEEQSLPPYLIFSDATLRDLARRQPSTRDGLLRVSGIGARKAEAYGEEFLAEIASYCNQSGLPQDVGDRADAEREPTTKSTGLAKRRAFELFAAGRPVDEVRQQVSRAESTTWGYLLEYVEQSGLEDPTPWVEPELAARIRGAAERAEGGRITPLFDALEGAASYGQIRIVLACQRNSERSGALDASR